MTVKVAGFDQAEKMLQALRAGPATPAAVELQCQSPCRAIVLIAGFEGGEEEVVWMAERLAADWRSLGGEEVTNNEHIPRVEECWPWLNLPAVFQINVLCSDLFPVANAVCEAVPDVWLDAHAFNGVLRGRWRQDKPSSAELRRIICDVLRPIAVGAGGNLVVLAPPEDDPWTAEELWGDIGPGQTVMRTIAEAFGTGGHWNVKQRDAATASARHGL